MRSQSIKEIGIEFLESLELDAKVSRRTLLQILGILGGGTGLAANAFGVRPEMSALNELKRLAAETGYEIIFYDGKHTVFYSGSGNDQARQTGNDQARQRLIWHKDCYGSHRVFGPLRDLVFFSNSRPDYTGGLPVETRQALGARDGQILHGIDGLNIAEQRTNAQERYGSIVDIVRSAAAQKGKDLTVVEKDHRTIYFF